MGKLPYPDILSYLHLGLLCSDVWHDELGLRSGVVEEKMFHCNQGVVILQFPIFIIACTEVVP